MDFIFANQKYLIIDLLDGLDFSQKSQETLMHIIEILTK